MVITLKFVSCLHVSSWLSILPKRLGSEFILSSCCNFSAQSSCWGFMAGICMPLIIDLDAAFYNNVVMIFVNDCRYVSVGDVVHSSYDPPEFAMVYRDENDGRFAPPEGFDLVGT